MRHKWRKYGRKLFIQETMAYVLGLVLVVTVSIIEHFSRVGDGDSVGGSPARNCAAVFLVLLGIQTTLSFRQEVLEMIYGGGGLWAYYHDPFNAVAFIRNIATYACIAAYFARSEVTFQESLSVAVFFWWMGLLYYMQALHVGPVIRMIIDMLYDISDILLVFFVLLLAISNSLVTLLKGAEDTGFETFQTSLFTSYKLLLLGEFDDADFITAEENHTRYIAILLFLAASLIGVVVLLNLIIARMGDSYERIQEKADEERLRLLARIIHGFELRFTAAHRADEALFPKWLQVLLPRGANVGMIAKPDWAGLLSELRVTIEKGVVAIISSRGKEKKKEMLDAHRRHGAVRDRQPQRGGDPSGGGHGDDGDDDGDDGGADSDDGEDRGDGGGASPSPWPAGTAGNDRQTLPPDVGQRRGRRWGRRRAGGGGEEASLQALAARMTSMESKLDALVDNMQQISTALGRPGAEGGSGGLAREVDF